MLLRLAFRTNQDHRFGPPSRLPRMAWITSNNSAVDQPNMSMSAADCAAPTRR
jgi:hypothetical protein